MNSDLFTMFAARRLNATALVTSDDDEKTRDFHMSLNSAYHLFKWTLDTRNPNGRLFQYHPGFITTPTPNALADQVDRQYFIGLHEQMFVSVSEFALFCFAQSDFFAEMGDASKETSPPPWDETVPGLWLIDNTTQGGSVGEEHSHQLIPTDLTALAR